MTRITITDTDETVVHDVPIRVLEEDNDVDGYQEAEEDRMHRAELAYEAWRERDASA